MAMVPYDRDTFSRMYEMNLTGTSDDGWASDHNNGPTVSDRLQTLLQSAREANITAKQQPPEDFLARLRQEQENTTAAHEKDIKLALTQLISTIRLNALENRIGFQSEAALVSQATQTYGESPYFQVLLAKATNEAYQRGFEAGTEEGIRIGAEQGRMTGMSDGLAAGRRLGRAESLKQGRKVDLQRVIEIGKQNGVDEGVPEETKGRTSEMIQQDEDIIATFGPTKKPVAVKVPLVSPESLPNPDTKEKMKPAIDPFQSLLGLARMR
ncbi:uncharacterized protein K460DRAFT_391078 [Cucurbitaria berberidis CBS 394.84]|uniref:Essential protein Yae1 N-terminal domain-containing protein n=1 Tax=Cucurbitaria berberidis CBS 394.84 TaxID=1168544 RepID=A0A9P4GQ81_9PLEO|nr:uncharacterized protein K460DRAFT_391078 [Cucurbitaria berberidis CBS 394.84]KAF1850618.1 hypothetical protein K460DRAFT_391078 [Cucurbitaria berberidis CBS 394.84]